MRDGAGKRQQTSNATVPLSAEQVRAMLPHRYPMLLVDRVLELEPGKRVVAIKNVTVNEPFCQGHFPGFAIMPGVLVLECMAQAAGVMMLSEQESRGKMPYLCTVERARFRRPVVPGDTLRIEVELLWTRQKIGRARCTCRVDGDLVADCEMMFAIRAWPGPADGTGEADRGSL
jgi:beta-hydroxyacyl-ACP dehydratase FabZ